MGNLIAFLALLVSIFGAAWIVYQDSGRWRRLERYGSAIQAAQSGSLEQATLQSVFNHFALPLALETLAPPRKTLRRWAWAVIWTDLLFEVVWILMVTIDQRGAISWTVYGIGLFVLVIGVALRATWRDRRQQWMREEMDRRREKLAQRLAS